MLLGDEHALSVGVDVQRYRYFFLILTALVAGTAVSVCGAISFVGLVAPHMLRLVTGPGAKRLLPACVLGGGLFLMFCDLLARLLSAHTEVPMGIVTSLMGVPFFLWLLTRAKRGAW
jgi:iron complex transport system permease protein